VSRLETDPILEGQQAAALKEVMTNLVLNAVQAVEDGTEIIIESRSPREGDLEVSISDSGPGIPKELEERIFEPFFTTKQRGTGLGLAIVARRVRELGGDIRLESPITTNRGARFVVVFPVAQLVST
jgi:signal transduction histidine kinase